MDRNTKIKEMKINDEFFMAGFEETGNTIAQRLQKLGEGGVVLVTKEGRKVVGYVTEKEIVSSVAAGFNPQQLPASQLINNDFMEIMGEDTLGDVLPLISERYPNAIVVINFDGDCIGFFSKNDYKDALAGLGCYDKSHEPETPEEWRTKGIAMSSMDRMADALECYEKSLALFTDKEGAWFGLAQSFEMDNRFKDSIMCYDRVVTINPNNDDAWLNRGNVYSMLHLQDRAVQSYNRALTIDPNSDKVLINMGLALSELGNVNKAIECYETAEALIGESPVLWYRKGNAYDKAEKYKMAITCYDRAIQLNHNHEDSWFNKGAALHMMGKDKKAVMCLQELLKLNPSNESAREAIEICHGNKSFFGK